MVRASIILGVVCVMLAGCAHRAYEGPRRLSGELATVIPNPASSRVGVMITSIDGRTVDAMYDKVEVVPGVHTLAVKVLPELPEIMPPTRHGGQRNWELWEHAIEMTLTLTAEAGHTYAFDGLHRYNNAEAWVIDRDTGARVAEGSGQLQR